MAKTTNDRLVAVYAGLLGLLGVLWLRCVWLQVVHVGKLGHLAAAQHQVSQVIVGQRGTISDRTGRVLAMSVRAPSIFASPRQIAEKEDATVRLATALGRSPQMIAQRLDLDRGFVWVARQVDPDQAERLGPGRHDGIGIVEELKRIYPHGTLASHLLGYVDIDQKGLEGVELGFNGVLRSRPGWQSTLRDAKGDLLIGPWTVETQPQDGYDVVLTIDSVVQAVVEDALAWGVKKFHAKGGSIIVMDPATGQMLAMANQPTFDPNHPAGAASGSRRNRAITDVFEPGSIFKIVTASALLEEGAIRPEEQIFCENGAYKTLGHHVLHDHRPHGWLSFHDVIMNSSNIGTAKAAQRLSPETLYRYIRLFGFGQKTGFELPGEVSGMIKPPSQWSKLSPFVIPIGQEVGVTPVQIAVMMSTIANGGWKVKPSVVARIQTPEGRLIRDWQHHASQRILRPETVQHVQDMLVSVVESGTGQLANVQGLTVAGKTGTAQKLEPTGRYSHSLFVASFVGYGPVPDPRAVIVVSIDEPRPLYFGGVVAAPIFRRVVEQLISYWGFHRSTATTTVARLPVRD